jgi:hypothetical protein
MTRLSQLPRLRKNNERSPLKLDYEVLMVCENLEPLMALKEYRWLDSFVKGRKTLVLFRGTKGIFSTKFPAEFIAADTRPTLAFFDFDPAGLSMATSLRRREALCLPPMIDLEAAVKEKRRDGLYAKSVNKCRARLDRVTDLSIGLAWIRMKALACGLDQEGFPRGPVSDKLVQPGTGCHFIIREPRVDVPFEPDAMGFWQHPDFRWSLVPEDIGVNQYFLDAGFELATVDRDQDSDGPDSGCAGWVPEPLGNGWILVVVTDTEDGAQAVFARRSKG